MDFNNGYYDNTTATSTNWMHMGLYEWTISRGADISDIVFYVYGGGKVYCDSVYYGDTAVRPSFNLESSITYVSGDGTQNSPIRITD